MIRKGDRLENPVTGEVLIFHRTSATTGGEAVLVETIVRPEGFVAAAHVHPRHTERFEVLEGRLGLRVGDKELLAGPGDVRSERPRASAQTPALVGARSWSQSGRGPGSTSSRGVRRSSWRRRVAR